MTKVTVYRYKKHDPLSASGGMVLMPRYATEEAIKMSRAALVEGSGIEVDASRLDENGWLKKDATAG